MITRRDWLAAAALAPASPSLFAQQPSATSLTDCFAANEKKLDGRLGAYKTLNDYFPFKPLKPEEWATRAAELRTQLKVALGLWPELPKTNLDAVIHGKITKADHTIEKVYFESTPGHFVTGNLYRPLKTNGKAPAVLFAHGHWSNGRFHVEDDANAKKMVDRGEEADLKQAKFFMQAIPITLARLGFVVFQFDMVGYAESTAIPHISKSGVPHAQGFADTEGELRLQSLLGLQALNCLRSVDFVASLSDVDSKRIGMTGASGGGTQTFLTAALDERIACAVPAVMVSTGMQGGCVCENCSLLRVGTGNVEIAALIAPRPLALTGANDWTKEIETKGLPELKKLYESLGQPDKIACQAWVQFPHNYNRPAREFMYRFMLKHLMGKVDNEYREPTFEPTPIDQLKVFDDKNPRPKESYATELRKAMTAATPKSFDEKTTIAALKAMLVTDYPKSISIRKKPDEIKTAEVTIHKTLLGRNDGNENIPTMGMFSSKFTGEKVCVWLSDEGKGSLFEKEKLVPNAKTLADMGFALLLPDLLGVGEAKPSAVRKVNQVYSGFTYGYNRSPLAEKVHDALTIVCFAKTVLKAKTLLLVDQTKHGLVGLFVSILAKEAVSHTFFDVGDYRFATIKTIDDPLLLPGAVKYGDVPAFSKLAGRHSPFSGANLFEIAKKLS